MQSRKRHSSVHVEPHSSVPWHLSICDSTFVDLHTLKHAPLRWIVLKKPLKIKSRWNAKEFKATWNLPLLKKEVQRKVLREIHNILQTFKLEVPTTCSPTGHLEARDSSASHLVPNFINFHQRNETECLRLAQDTMRKKVDNIARIHRYLNSQLASLERIYSTLEVTQARFPHLS